jgi:hypothetical protein
MGDCIKNCSTKITCSLEENSAAESTFVKDSLVHILFQYMVDLDYITLEMKSVVVAKYRTRMESVLLVKPVLKK